jgi:hypothetical protein
MAKDHTKAPSVERIAPLRWRLPRILARPVVLLCGLLAIASTLTRQETKPTLPATAPKAAAPARPAPQPIASPVVNFDQRAVADAAAERDHLAEELKQAQLRIARFEREALGARAAIAAARSLESSLEQRLRSSLATSAALDSNAQQARADLDRLEGERLALEEAPRPRRNALIDRTPVARPARGEEYHFELRGNRIAYIDILRLVDRVEVDARMQVRLSPSSPAITGEVGPIGDFSMQYELVRGRADDVLGSASATYNLRGWEIVPTREFRGEALDEALAQSSDFLTVLGRVDKLRDTLTLWIYPDAFPLYRRLRDTLAASGYAVAARPLPEGVPIRGSPAGSISAAQ